MSSKNPILIIQNNTDVIQAVNLFNIRPNLSGNINADQIYRWNVTTQDLNQLTNVQIQVSTPGQIGFTTLTATINSNNVVGIIDALNSLNVGYFYATTISGSTIINSANKIFTYGNLTINQQPENWITTGSLTLNVPILFGPAAMISLDLRSLVVLSTVFEPSPFLGEVIPYNFSTTFPFSDLQNGDSIRTEIQGSLFGPAAFRLIVKQNGIQILDQTQISSFNTFFFFNYLSNAIYDFTATIS